MTSNKQQYFYVKVIEAHGVIVKGVSDYCEPFVTVKKNGHEYLHKKSTKFHSGVEWWEQSFRFKIKSVEIDWVAVELREKGLHLMSSDWIGEVCLKVKEYKDGFVHEDWFKLGKGSWKMHTRQPRGYLHLAIQLKDNKYDRPFEIEPKAKRQTFEEWRAKMSSQTSILKEVKDEKSKSKEPEKFYQTFDTIEEAEHKIGKDAWKILMVEQPTDKELAEMKKLNRVNCLHKGNFDSCTGKRYMVCIDGTKSAKDAFFNVMKLVDPERDHVFIVTVRERAVADDFYDDHNKAILIHKLWRAAAGIVNTYQDELVRLFEGKLEYTSIMPEAFDAREMVCALAKKYKADVLVIGKHKDNEVRHSSKYFRSFQKYCQGHARCTVMTF